MTARMNISFQVSDQTTISDLQDRLELTADLQGIRLGTVDWTDPHTRPDLPGEWVTATAPITRITTTPPRKGKKR